MRKYRLIDRQGMGAFSRQSFDSREKVAEQLRSYHSADVEGAENMSLEDLLEIGDWELGIVKDGVNMLCPMCDTTLTWNPTNPLYKSNEDTTHIYVCPDCPFIGLEYFEDRNLEDLKNYLNRK